MIDDVKGSQSFDPLYVIPSRNYETNIFSVSYGRDFLMSPYATTLTRPEFLASPNVLDEEQFILIEQALNNERFAEVHADVHQQALNEVERKRQLYISGETNNANEMVHHRNDCLGYQRRYLTLEKHSDDPAELTEAAEARKHNVRTDFNESLQALTWDAPEPRMYQYSDTGRLHDGGFYIDEMMFNALTPVNDETELKRRPLEAANLAAFEAEGRESVECPGSAMIEFSLRNTDPNAKGYVDEIDKMQIRYSKFVDTDEGRVMVMQPVYITGFFYDEGFVNKFLISKGAQNEDELYDRTELLGRPLRAPVTEVESAIDIIREMDQFYEEETGSKMFMGQPVDSASDVTYDDVPKIIAERNERSERAVDALDEFSLELARGDTPPELAELLLENEKKEWAIAVCRVNPEQAKITFNQSTFDLVVAANTLELQGGPQSEVNALVTRAYQEAPDMKGCGASCGIREAKTTEVAEAVKNGLSAYGDKKFYVDGKFVCPLCKNSGGIRAGNGVLCVNKSCPGLHKDGKLQEKVNTKSDEGSGSEEEDDDQLVLSVQEVQAQYEAKLERRLSEKTAALVS